jgi:hypothetical protein
VLLQLLPFALPLVWFILVLSPDSPRALNYAELHPESTLSGMGYNAISTTDADDLEDIEPTSLPLSKSTNGSLSLQDKWAIASSLLLKYMLPLCESFIEECVCKY